MKARQFWLVGIAIVIGLGGPLSTRAESATDTVVCPVGCTCVCQEVEPEETAETEETGDTAETETTETPKEASFEVVLNEILPDPEGTDADGEFVEVMNLGPDEADLTGWKVKIGTKSFALDGTVLGKDTYHYWVYGESKLYLSNSGQTIELLKADGQRADAVTYPAAKTGQAYARKDTGSYEWTMTPTPGTENAFVSEHPEGNADNSETTDGATETAVTATDPTTVAEGTETITVLTGLFVSEFLPDPEGSDDGEWIEVINRTAAAMALNGWRLDDAEGGSGPYGLDGYSVGPGGYLLLPKSETGLALNNGGDDVRLINPNGTVTDTVTYGAAPTGQAHAKIRERMVWTAETTPGRPTPNRQTKHSMTQPRNRPFGPPSRGRGEDRNNEIETVTRHGRGGDEPNFRTAGTGRRDGRNGGRNGQPAPERRRQDDFDD